MYDLFKGKEVDNQKQKKMLFSTARILPSAKRTKGTIFKPCTSSALIGVPQKPVEAILPAFIFVVLLWGLILL